MNIPNAYLVLFRKVWHEWAAVGGGIKTLNKLGVFYKELAVFSDLEQKEGLLCSVNTYKKSHSKVAQIWTLKIKTS